MKKAMIAVAAVLCLGLASCSSSCKCTETVAGEVVATVSVSEKTLSAVGMTCEQYNEILQLEMGEEGKEYSIKCK